MGKINDFDMKNWKEDCADIITDSLRIINEREKSGKHSNFYHGNFIPQIPNQFIRRYTKKGDYVLDMFIGSGTTAIECEKLGRNVIGVDLNKDLIDRLDTLIDGKIDKFFVCGDSTKESTVKKIQDHLKTKKREFVDLALLHPPYFDIIKFSNKKEDLSNANSVNDFLDMFGKVLENCKTLVKKGGYIGIVIGDKYQNSERVPLGFMCMQKAQEIGFKLKSIIVKNMEGNRGKLGVGGIRRYRALSADYYIFKHEYIFLLKK